MAKRKTPMTRTVRIYERDAKRIESIMSATGKGISFADVVNDALRRAYADQMKTIDEMIDQVENSISDTIRGEEDEAS